MEKSDIKLGQMVRTNRYLHGVPPNTLGVICEVNEDQIMVAWYLCDKPLPNLTPESIAKLPEDDPQCPLRDTLDIETEIQHLDVN